MPIRLEKPTETTIYEFIKFMKSKKLPLINMDKITNDDIRKFTVKEFGFRAKNNWIAHAKEVYGIPVKRAINRKGEERLWPCPKIHLEHIKQAFLHLGILKE